MSYQYLTCQEQQGTALITLNRPEKRNALSVALRREIVNCLAELEKEGGGAYGCRAFFLCRF